MEDNLTEIAKEWRNAGIHADIPAELFRSITDGARGWEKRVVKNIAFHSVLFNQDGSVRAWDELVSGWEYEKSTFGDHHYCEVCGKNPISENCHITNQETGESLIVGNLCVIRYLDIVVDGVQLTEEEKREFLTGQMTEARKEFYRKEFMDQCPSVWDDLKAFEDLLNEEDPSLLKSMIRRMQTHGFPGKVLERKWLEFLSTADIRKAMFDKENAKRRQREQLLRDEMKMRAVKRAQILKRNREQRSMIAEEIDEWMQQDGFWCTPKEEAHLKELKSRLSAGGIASRKDQSMQQDIINRMERISQGYIEGEDPEQTWLRDLDPEPLTHGQRVFRMTCLGKQSLDQGDKSMVRRLKIRYG